MLNNKNYYKISFTGDIMSSEQQNCVVKKGEQYDYKGIYNNAKTIFSDSDFIVGNLETTIAGEDMRYTSEAASFNTPESLLDELKHLGFNLVSLANNHILDRGTEGLRRTIYTLEKKQIEYIGAYKTIENSSNIYIKKYKGINISFLSYTYGVNSEIHGNKLEGAEEGLVDILKQQQEKGDVRFQNDIKCGSKILDQLLKYIFKCYRKIGRRIGFYKFQHIHIDCVDDKEINNGQNTIYINRFLTKIRKAKSTSDIVIVCLHIGGQYNNKIGLYTQYIYKLIEKEGVDLVVGNHPHCVLGYKKNKEKLYTYSLGNFSFTPGDEWYVDGVYAEYSIVLHLYVYENKNRKITFSVVRNVVDEQGLSKTYDVCELKKRPEIISYKTLFHDVCIVVKRFSGKKIISIEREYSIE